MGENAEYRRLYRKAKRQIARRDWIANHLPVVGPLMFKFWTWRSR